MLGRRGGVMEWNEGCVTLGNRMCHWGIGVLEIDYL